MTIKITPDNSVAIPDSAETDDAPATVREAVEVSARTAMVLNELGMGFDMTPEDEAQAAKLFDAVRKQAEVKELPKELNTPTVAAKVGALLKAYDQQIVADAVQLRTLITNKLVLLADCGDTKYELRALELLGKISDVGLFVEKSEITITHKTTEDLEKDIRERISRLIKANSTDVEPLVNNVEEELGIKEPLTLEMAEDTDEKSDNQ